MADKTLLRVTSVEPITVDYLQNLLASLEDALEKAHQTGFGDIGSQMVLAFAAALGIDASTSSSDAVIIIDVITQDPAIKQILVGSDGNIRPFVDAVMDKFNIQLDDEDGVYHAPMTADDLSASMLSISSTIANVAQQTNLLFLRQNNWPGKMPPKPADKTMATDPTITKLNISEPLEITQDYVLNLSLGLGKAWKDASGEPLTTSSSQMLLAFALSVGLSASDASQIVGLVLGNPTLLKAMMDPSGDLVAFTNVLMKSYEIYGTDTTMSFTDPVSFAFRMYQCIDQATKVLGAKNVLPDPSKTLGPKQGADVAPTKEVVGKVDPGTLQPKNPAGADADQKAAGMSTGAKVAVVGGAVAVVVGAVFLGRSMANSQG
jgi:hypothetical protein